jgi:hypothetical protein
VSFKKILYVLFFLITAAAGFTQTVGVTVIDKDLDFPLEGVALYY